MSRWAPWEEVILCAEVKGHYYNDRTKEAVNVDWEAIAKKVDGKKGTGAEERTGIAVKKHWIEILQNETDNGKSRRQKLGIILLPRNNANYKFEFRQPALDLDAPVPHENRRTALFRSESPQPMFDTLENGGFRDTVAYSDQFPSPPPSTVSTPLRSGNLDWQSSGATATPRKTHRLISSVASEHEHSRSDSPETIRFDTLDTDGYQDRPQQAYSFQPPPISGALYPRVATTPFYPSIAYNSSAGTHSHPTPTPTTSRRPPAVCSQQQAGSGYDTNTSHSYDRERRLIPARFAGRSRSPASRGEWTSHTGKRQGGFGGRTDVGAGAAPPSKPLSPGSTSRHSRHDRAGSSSRDRRAGSSSRDPRFQPTAPFPSSTPTHPFPPQPYPQHYSSLGKYKPRNRRQSLHSEFKKISIDN